MMFDDFYLLRLEEDEKYERKKKQTARCDAFVYLRWGRKLVEVNWLREIIKINK